MLWEKFTSRGSNIKLHAWEAPSYYQSVASAAKEIKDVFSVQSKFLGGEGVVDGEGGSSESCLKWGGVGGGSLRDLSKNILK